MNGIHIFCYYICMLSIFGFRSKFWFLKHLGKAGSPPEQSWITRNGNCAQLEYPHVNGRRTDNVMTRVDVISASYFLPSMKCVHVDHLTNNVVGFLLTPQAWCCAVYEVCLVCVPLLVYLRWAVNTKFLVDKPCAEHNWAFQWGYSNTRLHDQIFGFKPESYLGFSKPEYGILGFFCGWPCATGTLLIFRFWKSYWLHVNVFRVFLLPCVWALYRLLSVNKKKKKCLYVAKLLPSLQHLIYLYFALLLPQSNFWLTVGNSVL